MPYILISVFVNRVCERLVLSTYADGDDNDDNDDVHVHNHDSSCYFYGNVQLFHSNLTQ